MRHIYLSNLIRSFIVVLLVLLDPVKDIIHSNHKYRYFSQLKNSSSYDSEISQNQLNFSNKLENGHSTALEFDEFDENDLAIVDDIDNVLVSKIAQPLSSPPLDPSLGDPDQSLDNSRVASFDITSSPTAEAIDQKTINPGHSSPTSTSSGIGSCGLDNKESDYDMLSISSWELNLITSGDEDVLEDDDNRENNELHNESNNGNKTIENSPNIQCSSARTPFKILEKPYFFQKVQLKRRNAVREEFKISDKKPSWALHRPEPSQSLHNALGVESDVGGENKDTGVTIDFFIESEQHSFYATLNEFRHDSIYGEVPQFTSYRWVLMLCIDCLGYLEMVLCRDSIIMILISYTLLS